MIYFARSVGAGVALQRGKQLFDAASQQKRFYSIPHAGHNDSYDVGESTEQWQAFIASCVK